MEALKQLLASKEEQLVKRRTTSAAARPPSAPFSVEDLHIFSGFSNLTKKSKITSISLFVTESQDEALIAACDNSSFVQLFSVSKSAFRKFECKKAKQQKEERKKEEEEESEEDIVAVTSASFDDSGKFLFCFSCGRIFVFFIKTGELIVTFDASSSPFLSSASSSSSCSSPHLVAVGLPRETLAFTFSDDFSRVATIFEGSTRLFIFDSSKALSSDPIELHGEVRVPLITLPMHHLHGSAGAVTGIAFSPRLDELLTCSGASKKSSKTTSNVLTLWNIRSTFVASLEASSREPASSSAAHEALEERRKQQLEEAKDLGACCCFPSGKPAYISDSEPDTNSDDEDGSGSNDNNHKVYHERFIARFRHRSKNNNNNNNADVDVVSVVECGFGNKQSFVWSRDNTSCVRGYKILGREIIVPTPPPLPAPLVPTSSSPANAVSNASFDSTTSAASNQKSQQQKFSCRLVSTSPAGKCSKCGTLYEEHAPPNWNCQKCGTSLLFPKDKTSSCEACGRSFGLMASRSRCRGCSAVTCQSATCVFHQVTIESKPDEANEQERGTFVSKACIDCVAAACVPARPASFITVATSAAKKRQEKAKQRQLEDAVLISHSSPASEASAVANEEGGEGKKKEATEEEQKSAARIVAMLSGSQPDVRLSDDIISVVGRSVFRYCDQEAFEKGNVTNAGAVRSALAFLGDVVPPPFGSAFTLLGRVVGAYGSAMYNRRQLRWMQQRLGMLSPALLACYQSPSKETVEEFGIFLSRLNEFVGEAVDLIERAGLNADEENTGVLQKLGFMYYSLLTSEAEIETLQENLSRILIDFQFLRSLNVAGFSQKDLNCGTSATNASAEGCGEEAYREEMPFASEIEEGNFGTALDNNAATRRKNKVQNAMRKKILGKSNNNSSPTTKVESYGIHFNVNDDEDNTMSDTMSNASDDSETGGGDEDEVTISGDRLTLGSVIGTGSTSKIRSALIDDVLPVAVKIFNSQSERQKESARSEARLLRKLGAHQLFENVFGFTDEGNLVMERLGETLQKRILRTRKKNPALTPEDEEDAPTPYDKFSITRALIKALCILHEAGIAHQHLQPEEICFLYQPEEEEEKLLGIKKGSNNNSNNNSSKKKNKRFCRFIKILDLGSSTLIAGRGGKEENSISHDISIPNVEKSGENKDGSTDSEGEEEEQEEQEEETAEKKKKKNKKKKERKETVSLALAYAPPEMFSTEYNSSSSPASSSSSSSSSNEPGGEKQEEFKAEFAADVFALGQILYFLWSEKIPYENVTRIDVLLALKTQGVKCYSSLKDLVEKHNVPPTIGALIEAATFPDPAYRPTAAHLRSILRKLLSQHYGNFAALLTSEQVDPDVFFSTPPPTSAASCVAAVSPLIAKHEGDGDFKQQLVASGGSLKTEDSVEVVVVKEKKKKEEEEKEEKKESEEVVEKEEEKEEEEQDPEMKWLEEFPVPNETKKILRKEQVGESALVKLTEEDLKELGIPMAPRKLLVEEIEKRKNEEQEEEEEEEKEKKEE